jgi:hypothetical protein
MSWAVVGVFFLVSLLGMPLAFGLGAAGVVALAISDIDFNLLPSRMMSAVNAFPLMSIPFFILAGELMLKAGMMERLIDLANAVIGRVRGGLAHVTMIAGLGLSTVSGAAVADASALGSTLIPSLKKLYGTGFSAAVCAAAANLGPIIPPSGAMIVYAFMAGPSVSVGGMFMAGIVPGVILVICMMAMCSIIAIRRNYPLSGAAFSWRKIGAELRRSILIFMMPVVVIGGIVGRGLHCHRGFGRSGGVCTGHRLFCHAPAHAARPAGRAGPDGHHLGGGGRHDCLRVGGDLHADDRHVAPEAAAGHPGLHQRPDGVSGARGADPVRGGHVPRVECGCCVAPGLWFAVASPQACGGRVRRFTGAVGR